MLRASIQIGPLGPEQEAELEKTPAGRELVNVYRIVRNQSSRPTLSESLYGVWWEWHEGTECGFLVGTASIVVDPKDTAWQFERWYEVARDAGCRVVIDTPTQAFRRVVAFPDGEIEQHLVDMEGTLWVSVQELGALVGESEQTADNRVSLVRDLVARARDPIAGPAPGDTSVGGLQVSEGRADTLAAS